MSCCEKVKDHINILHIQYIRPSVVLNQSLCIMTLVHLSQGLMGGRIAHSPKIHIFIHHPVLFRQRKIFSLVANQNKPCQKHLSVMVNCLSQGFRKDWKCERTGLNQCAGYDQHSCHHFGACLEMHCHVSHGGLSHCPLLSQHGTGLPLSLLGRVAVYLGLGEATNLLRHSVPQSGHI